jgi:hypothetical protein
LECFFPQETRIAALLSYFVKEENVQPEEISRLLEEIKKMENQ